MIHHFRCEVMCDALPDLDGKQYKRCIAYERYQFKNAYNDHNRVSDAPSGVFSCGRHGLLVLRLDLLDFVLQLLFLAMFCGCSGTIPDC